MPERVRQKSKRPLADHFARFARKLAENVLDDPGRILGDDGKNWQVENKDTQDGPFCFATYSKDTRVQILRLGISLRDGTMDLVPDPKNLNSHSIFDVRQTNRTDEYVRAGGIAISKEVIVTARERKFVGPMSCPYTPDGDLDGLFLNTSKKEGDGRPDETIAVRIAPPEVRQIHRGAKDEASGVSWNKAPLHRLYLRKSGRVELLPYSAGRRIILGEIPLHFETPQAIWEFVQAEIRRILEASPLTQIMSPSSL